MYFVLYKILLPEVPLLLTDVLEKRCYIIVLARKKYLLGIVVKTKVVKCKKSISCFDLLLQYKKMYSWLKIYWNDFLLPFALRDKGLQRFLHRHKNFTFHKSYYLSTFHFFVHFALSEVDHRFFQSYFQSFVCWTQL